MTVGDFDDSRGNFNMQTKRRGRVIPARTHRIRLRAAYSDENSCWPSSPDAKELCAIVAGTAVGRKRRGVSSNHPIVCLGRARQPETTARHVLDVVGPSGGRGGKRKAQIGCRKGCGDLSDYARGGPRLRLRRDGTELKRRGNGHRGSVGRARKGGQGGDCTICDDLRRRGGACSCNLGESP